MHSPASIVLPTGTPAPAKVRSVDLAGPAGKLEAVVNEGAASARFAAVICHPHPKGGGTLHNKVVYHAMKALNAPQWGLGLPVLRFNFRGTGRSEGTHDGAAEAEDVLAALEWLEREYGRPIIAAGFSFGAAMALKACSLRQSGVKAVAALGLPTQAEGRRYRYGFLNELKMPKLFLSGDADQFGPAAEVERVAEGAAEPKQVVFISGADHFFGGRLEPMQQALAGWLREQVL